MMELSHSLTLNEDALNQIPEAKRPVFIFEWLRFLDKVLVAAQKSDIKGCQQKLVEQLTRHMQGAPGPPTRRLIARCLATLFSVGDTFLLFDTVNKCNDILRNKDDSPSFLPTKLAAICCVGCMYEKLGRMMGRSYEETVQILIKSLRSAESQTRIEIMHTLEKVCAGMGSAITNVHKEIYKVSRHYLTDRVMAVRCAAAKCLLEMLNHAPFLYTTEIESVATLCFRAFEGSNYEVRCSVAKLLGTLVAMTQLPSPKIKNPTVAHNKGAKQASLEEVLNILMSGFLRGGVGFLKGTGEIIKGSSSINREVRVGVTHAYVVFVQMLGGTWLERNIGTLIAHVLDLVTNPKAASSHVEAVYSRKCVNFILRGTIGKLLGEGAQAAACKEIAHIILKQMNSIDFSPENAKDCNQETLFSQHLLVCALQEMGNLILGLGTTATNLLSDQSLSLIDAIMAVLVHPCQAARLAASWCLRCICVAVPSQITPLIDRCVDGIENMRSSPEAIAGYSSALAAVLGSVRLSPLGVPHTKGKIIFNTAEELLRSASQNSRLSLNRTHAGWLLIGAIMTLGTAVVKGLLPRMLLLWRNSFPRSNKELESEKARGDAFTWQVTLEGRAGALSAMYSFLLHCPELLNDDITRRLLTPIESALAMLSKSTSSARSALSSSLSSSSRRRRRRQRRWPRADGPHGSDALMPEREKRIAARVCTRLSAIRDSRFRLGTRRLRDSAALTKENTKGRTRPYSYRLGRLCVQESSHQKLIYSGQLLNDSAQLKDILRQCDGSEDQAYTVHLVCTPQKMCAAKAMDQNQSTDNNVDTASATRHTHIRSNNVQNQSHENANVTASQHQQYLQQQYLDPRNSQQLAWMQQAYTHYFTQYMQLMAAQGIQLQASIPYLQQMNINTNDTAQHTYTTNNNNNVGDEQPQPAAQDAAEINAGNNGAGDDAAFNRDWLDFFYMLSRIVVLFGIVYFYSSPLRLLIVTFLGFAIYLYQGGFFRVQPILLAENNNGRADNNNQVLQNEVVGPQAVPQQQNAQVPTVQPEARTNANEENEEQRPGALAFTWTFFSSFFASLIPDQPNVI